ncbi:hypothetical protein IP70_19080 [alpha proteobacterium AAP38]|nr:hypothetical protein IP70_19080 [alpha proteobacterium AAP38]
MFAGVMSVGRKGWPMPRPTAASMAIPFAVFGQADAEGMAVSETAVLLERRRFVSAQNRDLELPRCCPKSGAWISFWGRIDNRADLARALGLVGVGDETTDAALVVAAWARFGRDLPAQLIGDFTLAVIDDARRQVFLARDPMGSRPLYYRYDNGVFAFASTAAALKFPGLPLTPDRGWIARSLWGGLSKHIERTAYVEFQKLPGGHTLFLEADGTPQVERWHHWRDDAPFATRRDSAHVDAYRAMLEESVNCRLTSDYPVGVETSGGIDSSIAVALAARTLGSGDRLRTFGFANFEDEPELILATSQAYRIEHNYLATGYAVCEAESARVLAAIGYPAEHGNADFHVPFYREATLHGVRTLISGFGGDEVVSNQGQHALIEMQRAGAYRQLLEMLKGNALMRTARLAKRILMPPRAQTHNSAYLTDWRQRWPHCPLTNSVIDEHQVERDYFNSARFDGPYERVNDFILGHHLGPMDSTTRLENCTLAAAAWGIEYRWPLWDARLVQLYLSTPTIEKFGPRGIGRYLHRRAIDGIVPSKVAWRMTKWMGSPVGRHLDPRDLADWGRVLRDKMPSDVAAVIDPEKLDRLIDGLEGTPDYEYRALCRRTFTSLSSVSRWLE